jgi:hypothetical protein
MAKKSVTDEIRALVGQAPTDVVEEVETEEVTDTTDGGIETEEVDQIDELSDAKMTAYMNRAGEDKARETHRAVLHKGKPGEVEADKRIGKRVIGMKRAALKLQREQEEAAEMIEVGDEEETIDETTAADTLKPGAMSIPDPKAITKVGILHQTMGILSGMNKQDLTHWFNATMAQFGPGKTYGVGDNSAAMKSSVSMKASAANAAGPDTHDAMPKLAVKEDLADIFEGTELTEDFKERATTIVEAVVGLKYMAEVAELEEAYEEALAEEVAAVAEALEEQLEIYLDHFTEKFMEENTLAVESALRNELTADFIEGMKGLFAEHYIDLPEERVDVVEELAKKVEELEGQLDEEITRNAELMEEIVAAEIENVFDAVAEGLTLTEKDKFASLAEGIDFNGDVELFQKKLEIVKENYFKRGKTGDTNIAEETFDAGDELNEDATKYLEPDISRYVKAISRTVKS